MTEARRSLVAVAIALALAGGLLVARNLLVTRDPLDHLTATPAPGGTQYDGSWYFPRGGPYILGFESPGGDATLEVDEQPVARGRGVQSARVLHAAGTHAVRLVAPPGARLLWHPPGRRGKNELEYVPPSSLDSAPPPDASFGPWPGASPADGVFAGLLAALAIALGCYLARGALRRVDRRSLALVGGVFAVALAIRLVDLGGAGQTWDEDVNWAAGRNYVTNLLSLDFSPASWRWNYEHPPLSKYVAGLGAQLADGYGPARALSALLVALGCALLVPIGRRLFSLRVGVLAGGIAAFTPHLIAHGKVVGHEAPAFFLWTLGVWLALTAHDRTGDLPPREAARRLAGRLALCGVVLGLAVSSRFVNVLLAPLLGAILLALAPRGARARTTLLGAVILPLVAVVVLVVLWPRLWETPIAHLDEAWQRLRVPHSPEPYLGTITNEPARGYFAVYLLATAPLGVLLGALAWLVRAGHRRERASLVVALWLIVPMLVLLSPVRQDGVRYVMPSLAAMAMAAAAGVDWLVALAARRLGREPRLFAGAAAVIGVYLAITCWRIHPYYLDYYGEQVGGPSAVAEKKLFEVAWWGEGIADAVEYVNRHAGADARVHKKCVEPLTHLTWLRGDLWRPEVQDARKADWIIVYQPSWRSCKLPPDAVLAHEVRAQGAPLARVYRRANVQPR